MEQKYEDCCSIRRVLLKEDAEFIKSLFKGLERKTPQGEMLGVVADVKKHNCPRLYSWGYEYYCDNQEILQSHMDKIKGWDVAPDSGLWETEK